MTALALPFLRQVETYYDLSRRQAPSMAALDCLQPPDKKRGGPGGSKAGGSGSKRRPGPPAEKRARSSSGSAGDPTWTAGMDTPGGRKNRGEERPTTLELERVTLEVDRCLGKGAFAAVYLVHNMDTWSLANTTFALKVEKPASCWEFYICDQILRRTAPILAPKFPRVHSQHSYANASFFLMDYIDTGSLQDVINLYLEKGLKMPEVLAAYYTIEIISLIDALHKGQIIHGDIKPDNFLILNEFGLDNLGDWQPNNEAGWAHKGIKLIDYGRSIDLSLYPPGTRFRADFHADAFRCIEMITNRDWTFQVDIFGVAAVAHCMLHGSYMEPVDDSRTKRWKPKLPFKRYWDAALWEGLFDACLNIADCDHQPNLTEMRERFEQWLLRDPTRVRSIKPALAKQTIMLLEQKGR